MQHWFILFLGTVFSTCALSLTDQSPRLEDILEQGQLSAGDCDRYFAGQNDENTKLRCGKWQFFYGDLGRPGYPATLIDVFRKSAPVHLGPDLEGWGLIPSPPLGQKAQLPIGLSPGPELDKGVPTYTLTCALCHVGKLKDGRYVVGQPNHRLDYAGLTMAVTAGPELALQPFKKLPPRTEAKMGDLFREIFRDPRTRLEVAAIIPKLLPSSIKLKKRALRDDELETMSSWPRGVLDPIAYPSVDDAVPVPLRILPLWGLMPGENSAGHGAMMTSSGGTPDLHAILLTGAKITDISAGTHLAAAYDPEQTEPLIAYIQSLKPPRYAGPLNPERVNRGRALFDASCRSCHGGKNYAGTQIYSFEEIGTDQKLASIYDQAGTGEPVLGIVEPSELTGGIRSPRLSGMWSMGLVLHNGSLASLEELFCLRGPRPVNSDAGLSTEGHRLTCDQFASSEKEDLIEFLRSL